jgi:hypothetical protein
MKSCEGVSRHSRWTDLIVICTGRRQSTSAPPSTGKVTNVVSFRVQVQEVEARIAAEADPWRLRLERLRGKIDFDGLERVTSQTVLDVLEVPQRNRRAGTFRRLAKVMAELGWTAVRVRDLTGGGYKEQVRGYCRDARNRSN